MERYARREKSKVVADSLRRTIRATNQLIGEMRELLERGKEARKKK